MFQVVALTAASLTAAYEMDWKYGGLRNTDENSAEILQQWASRYELPAVFSTALVALSIFGFNHKTVLITGAITTLSLAAKQLTLWNHKSKKFNNIVEIPDNLLRIAFKVFNCGSAIYLYGRGGLLCKSLSLAFASYTGYALYQDLRETVKYCQSGAISFGNYLEDRRIPSCSKTSP